MESTVLRGVMGFGADSIIHMFKIEHLSEDLPIIVELVDARGKLENFLAVIESNIRAGLATLEKAEVHFYRSSK